MLTIHHLGVSQSERITFLCEELGFDYKLVNHTRDPTTRLSPESLKSIPGNETGTAPFMQDGDVTLTESAAIAEYILTKYGKGKLVIQPEDPEWPNYLYWFHASNGSLQPGLSLRMWAGFVGVGADHPMKTVVDQRAFKHLDNMDSRLGKTKWLAGSEFSAADIMCVWCVSTARYFSPTNLGKWPNILRWLADIGRRAGYRKAMEKGDPGMELALRAETPESGILVKDGRL